MNIPRNCDTCGKEIDLINSYKTFDKDGNPILVCEECKKKIGEIGPPQSPKNNIDDWGKESYDSRTKRPLGVTILAILQIIGTLIVIGTLISIPIIFEKKISQLLNEPLFYLLVIYSLLMIPISIILAVGLLKGREWARFYTRFFQIVNIVTSLLRLNFLGIIIPIYIFFYLGKDHVTDFFDKKNALNSRFWYLALIGVVGILIFSSVLAIYTNPMVQQQIINDSSSVNIDSYLIGDWENTDGTIHLTFNSNNTCIATKDDILYKGTWKVEGWKIKSTAVYWIEFNWENNFKLKHPNDPTYYYTIEEAYFIGENLSLYTMFESPPYYICYKN